jgi:amino acid transporter
MTTWGAAFLGVGSMVGAGIFALLGQAGAVAGAATWISFVIGGLIAALLSYAIARLAVRYPSSGGLMAYLTEAFGPGHLTGVTSWLYYFAAAIIVTAMVAVSFGSYGASLLFGNDASQVWVKVLASAIVVALAAVVIVGAGVVSKVQSIIVVLLLVVFAVFIVATMSQLNTSLLAPSGYPGWSKVVSAVALTFFAYLGFAVISFTAGDLEEPKRQLPRAMYLALGLTTVLYVLVSLGVFGSLTVAEVIQHGDTALAEAAKPVLGQAGFVMMSIAALLATASSINANLYGAGNVTASLAARKQFPTFFGAPSRLGGTRGLIVTALAILVVLNVFNLTAIASLGSAIALIIFAMVGIAALRLRRETRSQAWVLVLAVVMTLVVLVMFMIDLVHSSPATVAAIVIFTVLAIICEFAWSYVRADREHDAVHAGPQQKSG